MSELFEDQYTEYFQSTTPDMWNRIEASISSRIATKSLVNNRPLDYIENKRKEIGIKKWAPLLAAGIVFAIGIPIWLYQHPFAMNAPKMAFDTQLQVDSESDTSDSATFSREEFAYDEAGAIGESASSDAGVANESVSEMIEDENALYTTASTESLSELLMTVRIVEIKESTDVFNQVYGAIVVLEETNLVEAGREISVYFEEGSTPLEIGQEYSMVFYSLNGISMEEETEFLIVQ